MKSKCLQTKFLLKGQDNDVHIWEIDQTSLKDFR
jgi:hypothetical protein